MADALLARESDILAANEWDLAEYQDEGAGRDRLTLTSPRLASMAASLRDIAAAPTPLAR
jgi:glutamate-5-semialdehyde dehydrogenase